MRVSKKFRLITRSDFDGLVCAVLFKHLDVIDDITFVHPKDMQDGKIDVTENDISTNLPYVEGIHLSFDHHESETIRNQGNAGNHIIDPKAPSAARVVWKYYGGHDAFPARWDEMMEAVDRGDSAQFTLEQVLSPKGWDLLNFLMDARTGLGRFREFRISNYHLMMDLIDYCKDNDIQDIMKLPDVVERIDLYREQSEKFKQQIKRCAKVYDNLVVLDLRNEEVIHAGNRFIIYALFSECDISIHAMWGRQKQNTVFATGKSIFNRSSNINIGELMLKYGGGGHQAAGTCQVDNDKADEVLQELVTAINSGEQTKVLASQTFIRLNSQVASILHLGVGADRVARTNLAALGQLDEIRSNPGRVIPLACSDALSEGIFAIEVYSATRLKQSSIRSDGYTNKDNKPGRLEIINAASAEIYFIIDTDGMTQDDDPLNASICVLAEYHLNKGLCYPPGAMDAARKKGRIWVKSPQA